MKVWKVAGLMIFIASLLFVCWDIVQTEIREEAFFGFEQYCNSLGYQVITYEVMTDDGYILTLFRIPGKGKPVFLLHGLVVTSESYILNQCTKAPAFQLSDAGFDVWLGNLRGNHISSSHKLFSNDHEDYWDYSFEDYIDHDLHTFVHFVKTYTQSSKIVVIGHSLGGIIITHALSLHPEYSEHISLAVLLGTPAGKITPKSWYIRILGSGIIQAVSKMLRIKSFLYWFESRMMLKVVKYFRPIIRYFAKDMMDMDLIGGKDEDIDLYSYRNRGGISIKATEYLVQFYWDQHEHPKRFDFGEEGNLKRYGNSEPPRVFYSNISVNTAVLNGKFDTVFTQEDSKVFLKQIKKEFLVFYEDDYELDHGAILFSCNNSHFEEVIRLIFKFG